MVSKRQKPEGEFPIFDPPFLLNGPVGNAVGRVALGILLNPGIVIFPFCCLGFMLILFYSTEVLGYSIVLLIL